MDQDTIKRLMASEDGRKLADYLLKLVKELDRVSDIQVTSAVEIAAEVVGRQRASEKLKTALSTLLVDSPTHDTIGEHNPYVV